MNLLCTTPLTVPFDLRTQAPQLRLSSQPVEFPVGCIGCYGLRFWWRFWFEANLWNCAQHCRLAMKIITDSKKTINKGSKQRKRSATHDSALYQEPQVATTLDKLYSSKKTSEKVCDDCSLSHWIVNFPDFLRLHLLGPPNSAKIMIQPHHENASRNACWGRDGSNRNHKKSIRIETCGKKLLRIFYRRSTNAYIKITQLVKRQRKNHIADC